MRSSEIREGVCYRAVDGTARLVVNIYKRASDRTRYVVYRPPQGGEKEMRIDLFAATSSAAEPPPQ